MIHRISQMEDMTLFYDCERDECLIPIMDAASATQDAIQEVFHLCEKYEQEIRLIGRYLKTEGEWLSKASKNDLNILQSCRIVADYIKDEIEHELNRRRHARIGYIYVLRADNGLCKIGQAKVVDKRVKQLGLVLPYSLDLVCIVESERYKELESELHQHFTDRRIRGEWFELNEADVEYIKSLGAMA